MENYLTQITNYLLMQSWQIAVLVVVITAVNLALKNKSAHMRYLLWLIILAKCLVPPLFTVSVAILPEEKPAMALEPVDISIAEPVVSSSAPVLTPPAHIVREKPARVTARQWLGFGWIVGVAAFLLFALVKALRTDFWLWRQRKPLPAEPLIEIENLFSGLDLKTLPKVWLVDGIGQPFVWGLLSGSIYLPADFVKVNSSEHCRGVLGHELSHILRFDASVNLLQVFAQAVFWFHPFVWWANRKIRAEREKCCDEMAIACLNAQAKDYSRAIVDTLVAEYKSTRPIPSLAVAGPVKNIEERIKTMLRPGKKFYKHPSLPAVAIVVLTALLAVPTTVVLTVKAENQATTDSADEAPIFGTPTNLGPTVNSSAADYDPSISADGLSLYFASRRTGGYGNNDLYVTNRKTTEDPWETPLNLGPTVNSSGWDNAPSISADGLSLNFSSDRPGGYGEWDLWVATRETTSAPWGAPVNLGQTVNSPANEHGQCISGDGLSLYFAERFVGPFRPGGLGYGDIWVTTRKTTADPWDRPVNLGPAVNSSAQDRSPDISADQRMLFFSSFRTGGSGSVDLWVTSRSTTEDDWATPVNLGPNVNSSHIDSTPNISIDGSILYFHSGRPGALGGSGDTDIWQVSLKAQGAKD
ncbi:MAG: M56 family metallopeptidase [Planctomycetota bacterium]